MYCLPTLTFAEGFRVESAKNVADFYQKALKDEEREVFSILSLDQKHRVIEAGVLSIGNNLYTIVDPRFVIRWALTRKIIAGSLIVMHNHPSGEASPSQADFQVTQAIKEACNFVRLNLLDHIVVGKDDYYSFKEAGLLT